jgi:hypothetical protein
MRRTASALAILALVPHAAQAQRLELAPPRLAAEPAPNGDWCFGVRLTSRDRCANFTVLEIGARFRASSSTDHSERDHAHAYPTLENHGYLALGLAHRVGTRSALGVVGEYGAGGGERQAIGVRFDQQLGVVPRLDLTAGAVRVETRQHGLTKRRWATGAFVDGAIRANDLLVIQGRIEHFPGDGALVKPATAAFIGTRVEGGGAVRTTIVAVLVLTALEFVIFFGGGGGD